MKRRPIKTRFPYVLWHFTRAHENLFDLSRADMYVYQLLVKEALK